jgi:soluble lytic murein transglycosylase-like protein
MRALAILAGAGLLLLGILMTKKAKADTPAATPVAPAPDNSLGALFDKWGGAYGVDPLLLRAIAMTESGLDMLAVNPSDPSYGLMQILCTPGPDGKCSNKFNIDGWPGITRAQLLDPDTNIRMGAQILAWNLRTYGMPRGIAVYNAWDQRHSPVNGPFKNQRYVDKVLAERERLRRVA